MKKVILFFSVPIVAMAIAFAAFKLGSSRQLRIDKTASVVRLDFVTSTHTSTNASISANLEASDDGTNWHPFVIQMLKQK